MELSERGDWRCYNPPCQYDRAQRRARRLMAVAVVLLLMLPATTSAQEIDLCPAAGGAITFQVTADKPIAAGFCLEADDAVGVTSALYSLNGGPFAPIDASKLSERANARGAVAFATGPLTVSVGTHTLRVVAKLATGQFTPPSQAITVTATPETVDPCIGAVVLAVGDWTRTADGGASAQVFWTLGRSTQPVTKLTVYLDGVAAPDDPSYRNPVTGNTDLRGLGASRFRVPRDPGVHLLSLVAESSSGCKGTADRLMPLVVR